MSSVAAFVSLVESVTVANDCEIAAMAFIAYEYLLTWDQEVNLFWRRKFTGASVLFFLNRYILLLFCEMYGGATFTLGAIQYFVWAAFSGLRAFALSRSWLLGTLCFLLSVVPFPLNLVLYHFGPLGAIVPPFGCVAVQPIGPELGRRLTIASRSCLMTADLLLVVVTWYTLGRGRRTTGIKADGMTLAHILLRDGTIYFTVLFVLNCLHLTFAMLSFEFVFQTGSYITLFTNPLTAVIVSRFLLNLQAANQRAIAHDSDPYLVSRPSGTLVFERVLGSLATGTVSVGEDYMTESDSGQVLAENEDSHVEDMSPVIDILARDSDQGGSVLKG
ncbi:hypothetical protein L226DRAFT_616909 [Lentinus tigrinus ALCF2SS1-7]|uniref:uncharacterized protein n=1 Tax=Lentinus tigrinus ALCF2SS1-7 TaxID=1328758 RepID=UPI001165C9CB|nr:hypothetical protein L226DRAFT_616909 [Lentinus tigrinus ALCF2SS1-7]